MPLSEHEQRILRQIEQELASDPTFADRASRISRRRLFVLSLCVVVGLTVTVAGLAVNYWLAFAAFVGVLVLSSMLERELRLVSRDKLSNLPINAWLTGGTRNRRRNSES
jgi:Flp pilus assembly protein TadB